MKYLYAPPEAAPDSADTAWPSWLWGDDARGRAEHAANSFAAAKRGCPDAYRRANHCAKPNTLYRLLCPSPTVAAQPDADRANGSATQAGRRSSPDGDQPPARYDHSALFDPVRGQLLVFGGRGEGPLGDTWAFDVAARTWREVAGPGPEPRLGMAPSTMPPRAA